MPSLERLLTRDRTITLAGLLVLCALAWLYIVASAGPGMNVWDVTTGALFPTRHASGPTAMIAGMAMPSVSWEPAHWAWMIVMWWVMMIAMMTPSAAPAILLYAKVYHHALVQGHDRHRHVPTGLFASGYFLIWLLFSVIAAALQQVLEHAGVISAMTMASQVRGVSGAALLVTGLYQLSPLKSACLLHCRAPASFFAQHWYPYAGGALRMGATHGVYCVGCCWMLMGLLFVGGVMNLLWIAALSILVLAEKVLRLGRWVGYAAGLVLVVWGAALLLG